MEKVITCPICFSDDHCFEDTIEMEDSLEFKSYMCFRCGYTSNSKYTEESKERVSHLQNTAQLIKDLEVFDSTRGLYWYPSVVNMNTLGMIFPVGTLNEWNWKFARVIQIPEEDKEKYPVEGKPGEYYESRLDVEGAQTYGPYEFFQALNDMGIVKEL